jgi:Na+-translocating ferredoxin:NAD+ oxidoreductase RNF subunit RnfB
VRRIKAEETFFKALPGLDCGLCGSPSCETFAKDVAAGDAHHDECVFFSDKRLKQLRKTYLTSRKRPPEGGS